MLEDTILYLFSVKVISITADFWEKKVLLFFVDQHGQRHTYILRNYTPYILIHPNNADIDPCDVETHLGDSTSVVRIEVHEMTPLVGFTNERQDRVFRIYYNDIGHKYRIMKQLEQMDVTVLHRRISDELHLLHTTGWRLQSWFRLEGTPMRKTFVDNGQSGSIKIGQLIPTIAPMPIPPLSYAVIRLTIKSSTATTSNLFAPDHTIPQDVIQSCEIRRGLLNKPADTMLTTVIDMPK
jgi:hypothetical protein